MIDRPLRILHLVNRWELGGTRSHIRTLAGEQKRMGHDVSVAGDISEEAVTEDDPAHTHIRLYHFDGTRASVASMLRAAMFLRDHLRRNAIDVLHMHGRLVTPLGSIAVQGLPVARVYTSHAIHTESRPAARFPRHVICPGEISCVSFLRVCSRYGGFDVRIIPHGVGEEFFSIAGAPLADDTAPTVLFLGRHVEEKGGATLIEAARLLVEQGSATFQVLFCGEGKARIPWMDAVRRHGLEGRVRFLHAERPEDALRAARGIAVPTTGAEAFGLVIAEAFAAGKTVVASDLPAYREFVATGENGLLFPPGDAEALAACLRRVLEDGNLSRRLAMNARAFAEQHFRAPRMADETMAVYRDALEFRGIRTAG